MMSQDHPTVSCNIPVYTYTMDHKECHFTFDYNSRVSLLISIIIVPLQIAYLQYLFLFEIEINTLQRVTNDITLL